MHHQLSELLPGPKLGQALNSDNFSKNLSKSFIWNNSTFLLHFPQWYLLIYWLIWKQQLLNNTGHLTYRSAVAENQTEHTSSSFSGMQLVHITLHPFLSWLPLRKYYFLCKITTRRNSLWSVSSSALAWASSFSFIFVSLYSVYSFLASFKKILRWY